MNVIKTDGAHNGLVSTAVKNDISTYRLLIGHLYDATKMYLRFFGAYITHFINIKATR